MGYPDGLLGDEAHGVPYGLQKREVLFYRFYFLPAPGGRGPQREAVSELTTLCSRALQVTVLPDKSSLTGKT